MTPWKPWRGPVGELVQREKAAAALRVAKAFKGNYPAYARLEDWLAFKAEEVKMTPQEREKYNAQALQGHNLDEVMDRARILMCAAEADYFSEVPALAGGVKGQARVHAARLASELLLQKVEPEELLSGGLYDVMLNPLPDTSRPRRFATVFWARVWGRR